MNISNEMVDAAIYTYWNDTPPSERPWRSRIKMRDALTAALAVSGYGEVVEALEFAVLQIEYLHGYLHEKFQATGSGETVLLRSRAALSRLSPTIARDIVSQGN